MAPGETNYFTGTQGIVLEYDEQFPASETYETDPLPVVLTLKNLGAVDVPYSKILISFAYDPLYINGTKLARIDGDGLFHGRSAYYPSGDLEIFDFYDFRANRIVGLREAPETQLSAQLCYEYNTTFATQVCVDVDQFLRSGKPQSCSGEEVAAGSQGAPVAITAIEPRNSILNQGAGGVAVRPDFLVRLQNVGTGMVLGPPQAQFERACALGYPPEQLNTVAIRAQVFGIELECTPRLVRLRDGEGIARCTVPRSQLGNPALLVQQNFYTAVAVQASYVYKDAVSRQVTIHRLPGTEVSGTVYTGEGVRSKVKGYVYDTNSQIVLDSNGRPFTICQQYVADPSKAPGDIRAKINMNFTCSCSAAECREIDQNGKCFFGICPGSLECCDKGAAAIAAVPAPGPGEPAEGGEPATDEEQGPPAGGEKMMVRSTVYYLPNCVDYVGKPWSTTDNRNLGGAEACRIPESERGFYEDVKCQGSGYCDAKYYRYNSITPRQATSPTGEVETACGTLPRKKYTIAVNNDPGTPCYIPYGSRVYVDFGSGSSWNGYYYAEDTGVSITGCHIDVYAGQGKTNLDEGRRNADRQSAELTIVERGAGCGQQAAASNLIDCTVYAKWSTTTDPSLRTDSHRACDTAIKGFYEAVTCERRTGTCAGREWTYDMIPENDPRQ